MPPGLWPQAGVLLGLLALSAFFSSSETALFSLSLVQVRRLRESGGRSGRAVAHLLAYPRRLLITILVGNMVVNAALASVVAAVATELVGNEGLAIAIAVSTVLLLVFGEVTPKTFAVRHAERLARVVAPPLLVFAWAILPVRFVLRQVTNALLFVLRRGRLPAEPLLTRREIAAALEVGEAEGAIAEHEREILEHIIEFRQLDARELMVPRTEMVCVDEKATVAEALDLSEGLLPASEACADVAGSAVGKEEDGLRVDAPQGGPRCARELGAQEQVLMAEDGWMAAKIEDDCEGAPVDIVDAKQDKFTVERALLGIVAVGAQAVNLAAPKGEPCRCEPGIGFQRGACQLAFQHFPEDRIRRRLQAGDIGQETGRAGMGMRASDHGACGVQAQLVLQAQAKTFGDLQAYPQQVQTEEEQASITGFQQQCLSSKRVVDSLAATLPGGVALHGNTYGRCDVDLDRGCAQPVFRHGLTKSLSVPNSDPGAVCLRPHGHRGYHS